MKNSLLTDYNKFQKVSTLINLYENNDIIFINSLIESIKFAKLDYISLNEKLQFNISDDI